MAYFIRQIFRFQTAGSRLRHFLAASLLLVALTAVGITPVLVKETARRADERRDLNAFGTVVASSLEQQLERSLSSTFALASLVRQSGDRSIRDFDSIAAEIIETYGGIDSLQLAPGGVVSQIYPLAGNEQAIGHDLLNDPARRAESLKAIQSGSLTLAGPFELVQGGTAVIGRLPVFVPDDQGGERFWGFTIALIRLPNLLAATDLAIVAEQGHRYWLSRIHPDNGQRDVFAASVESEIQESATYNIVVPNGSWVLHLSESDDLSALWLKVQLILVVILSAMVSILIYTWLQRVTARQIAQRALDREINERIRLEAAELKLARELSVVDEIARIITSTLDTEEVYERFAQEVKKLVDFDRMSINICDKDTGQASIKHFVGQEVPGQFTGDTWSLDGTPFQVVIATGQTLLRSDISDRRFTSDQKFLDAGLHSVMLLPLTYQGTAIACMALRSRQIGAFSLRERVILERLAHQIAPAVANAELFEQSKRAAEDQRRWGEETSALAEIGRTISASLDIN